MQSRDCLSPGTPGGLVILICSVRSSKLLLSITILYYRCRTIFRRSVRQHYISAFISHKYLSHHRITARQL